MKERSATLLEPKLTARELNVIEQLISGATANEAAETLRVSFHTVRTHIRNVYGKLGVANRVELVRWFDSKV
jgi:ATP/maltotriose-dependent transcriptional regulator MalT